MGHLVRCASLAEAVRRRGGDALFVCRRLGDVAASWFGERKLTCRELADETSEPADAAVTLRIAHETACNAIVVDHYGLSGAWWKTVAAEFPLAAIDDLGRADLAPAVSLVVNPNAGASEAWYPGVPQALCGPRYALIRGEFRAQALARLNRQQAKSGPLRLLITLGGADPENATQLAASAAAEVNDIEHVDLVIGPAFPHRQTLIERFSVDSRITIHDQPRQLAELMARAGLAVTGGGSTVYESAFLGLPAVLLEIADNQAGVCRAMVEAGAACYAGQAMRLDPAALRDILKELVASPAKRLAMSLAGMELVDGLGAQRAAVALESLVKRSSVESLNQAR